MSEQRIEFVFGEVTDQLRSELKVFWKQHGQAYQEELRSFSVGSSHSHALQPADPPKKPLLRQPAAVSRDQSGVINGIMFVVLRELEDSLGLGSHAYFQRMYIVPESRHCGLTNRLFREFLQGFDREAERRDHRAKVLLSENINPGLQKAPMRRYFVRLGFQMLGRNQLGGEIWVRRLTTHFSF
mgnify:FL=1